VFGQTLWFCAWLNHFPLSFMDCSAWCGNCSCVLDHAWFLYNSGKAFRLVCKHKSREKTWLARPFASNFRGYPSYFGTVNFIPFGLRNGVAKAHTLEFFTKFAKVQRFDLRFFRPLRADLSIKKSSSFLPPLIAATSQRGLAPRPAQVSPDGPRYLGGTFLPFNALP